MSFRKKGIAILGSTGSIGTQALEVIDLHHEVLQVSLLTANSNADLLITQAIKYKPDAVVIGDDNKYQYVKDSLAKEDIKVFAGHAAIEQAVQLDETDMVLTAMVGFAGLKSTVKAIEAGKSIALANKETLVVAGELISELVAENKVAMVPVDSEHSAIFQCLAGEGYNPVEKIILTASGGPFRGMKKNSLENITKADALKHPNWSMGAKITIDSASMMNKGLEVIEARWLFGLEQEQIEVVIHPQSIIHSLVQFTDGSIKAQLGLPNMKLPIQYAFGYPQRLPNNFKRFSFTDYPTLTFEKPDTETFPNLQLAFDALKNGGNSPCVLNAANEIVVDAFLRERIRFTQMPGIIEKTLNKINYIKTPTLEDYVATDLESRQYSLSLLN